MSRAAQAAVGVVGIVGLGGFLFMDYAFATVMRWERGTAEWWAGFVETVFLRWPQPLVVSGVFMLLTGCAFLCARGIRAEGTAAGRIGGLAGAAAVAFAIMTLLLVPFLLPRS